MTIKQRLNKEIIYTLTGLSLLFPSFARAQSTTILTSEIAVKGEVLTFKIKPYYYVVEGRDNKSKLELLVGKYFKWDYKEYGAIKGALFGDWKIDSNERSWVGFRPTVVYAYKGLNIGLEFRHFTGLSKDSADHYYLIPFMDYKVTDYFTLGIKDQKKVDIENDREGAYLGPYAIFKITDSCSILVNYGEDRYSDKNSFYLQLRFKSQQR